MCFVCSDIARHVLLEKSMGIMPVCVSGDFFFGEACELLYTSMCEQYYSPGHDDKRRRMNLDGPK